MDNTAVPLRAYRKEPLLVVPKGATLPALCIKCGAPSTYGIEKTYSRGESVDERDLGQEVAERTREWNSDWRVGCTYTTLSPARYSFGMLFGRDGRVKSVSEVRGWD